MDASSNTPFSAGTKSQLNVPSLNTCTEEATEQNQIPARPGCGRYKSTPAFWSCDGQIFLGSSGRVIRALRKRAVYRMNELF